MHIFVSICSHRDPLLSHTVRDIMFQKSGEHDITYSIFDQSYLDEALCTTHPELAYHPDVIYKRIDPEYSDGVVWARHINMMNVRAHHDMFYQIDSHMLFDESWDKMIINDYTLAKELVSHDKVIITGSCKVFKYDPETDTTARIVHEEEITTRVKYYKLQPPQYVPGAHGDLVPATELPEPGFHILAGNFFTHCEWIKNIGLDPLLYYDTEEVMMSLQSWVAGYSIFHNTKTPCYHLQSTEEWPSKQWINPVVDIHKLAEAETRTKTIFADYIASLDPELLQRYKIEFGVDYINNKIEERARTYTIPDKTGYDPTAPIPKASLI